ncbi:MAG: TatA/E family twin arginine-targeting protein translocase [Acidobacteriota bacterium]
MFTLGVPEMAVIFILALVLFGPKKLPELGRTIGKAMTEFRRASNDLKATFDREMQSLERENQEIQSSTRKTVREIADQVSYDIMPGETIWNPLEPDTQASDSHQQTVAQDTAPPSTVGASEVLGAESHESFGVSPAGSLTPDLTETAKEIAAQGIEGTIPRTSGATPSAEIAEEVTAGAHPETLKNS